MREPTDEQLAHTRQIVSRGIWTCAVITMTASVFNGTSVFYVLTATVVGTVVGFLTAVAVDACLVVVLTGDRQMQSLGLSSRWGRYLRLFTLAMSLTLNCGASLIMGHYLLAIMHAFCPLLIAGMSEYGQETALAFQGKVAEREAVRQRVERERREAGERQTAATQQTSRELQTARDLAIAAERRAQAEELAALAAERKSAALQSMSNILTSVPEPISTQAKPHLVVDNTPRKSVARTSVTPGCNTPSEATQRAVGWLTERLDIGDDIRKVGPTEVSRGAGVNVNTAKKRLTDWRDMAMQIHNARAAIESVG